MLHKSISIILAMSLTFTSVSPAAMVVTDDEIQGQRDREEAIARLEDFTEILGQLRAHIDRSQFDRDALLNRLDYEAKEIVEMVGSEIHFEQYPGVLRGAMGTLLSRAGNSLDQSLLLATLLGEAGFDTRIQRGKLSSEDARQLIDRMFLPTITSPAPFGPDGDEALRALIQPDWQSTASDPDLISELSFSKTQDQLTNLYEEAQTTTTVLANLLKESGVTQGEPGLHSRLVEEAQDYFWVEYSTGPTNSWTAAHPVYGSDANPQVEILETMKDAIPATLHQRLRIEVEIERRFGERLERKAVTSAWEGSVANLIGTELQFTNLPSGLTGEEPFATLDEVADRTEFFIPLLNGKPAPGAQTFDLDGVTAPLDVAGSAAAGVFKTVGEKAESAATAIMNMDSKKEARSGTSDIRSLTGVWLKFTLIRPGREDQIIRRAFFNALSNKDRETKNFANLTAPDPHEATWELASVATIVVSSGKLLPAYLTDRTLQKLSNLQFVWNDVLNSAASNESQEPSPEAIDALQASPISYLQSISIPEFENPVGLVSYQASPSIAAAWQGLTPADENPTRWAAADIVNLGRVTYRNNSGTIETPVFEAMFAGVWATHAEQLIHFSGISGESRNYSAPQMMRDIHGQDVKLQVLTPANKYQIHEFDIPAEMGDQISSALEDGYTVILPASIEPGVSQGWWRIDTSTSETLGMANRGMGTATIEGLGLIAFTLAVYGSLATAAGVYFICSKFTACSQNQCQNQAARAWSIGMLLAYAFAGGGLALESALTIRAGGELTHSGHQVVQAYEMTTMGIDRGMEVKKLYGGSQCEP